MTQRARLISALCLVLGLVAGFVAGAYLKPLVRPTDLERIQAEQIKALQKLTDAYDSQREELKHALDEERKNRWAETPGALKL